MREDASTRSAYPEAVVAATINAALGRLRARRAPWLVGLSGLQGSGKSTFARQLATAANARGVSCVVLSLDDFYLGRRARRGLARAVHPLFATRGVPGTHDLDLLSRTLSALRRASARTPASLPRFDKGRDTRLPPSRWRRVTSPPRLVLLEGWCVGVPAQREAALHRPLNALECDEDRALQWRRHVNRELAHGYAALWRKLDALIVLQAPSFDVVARWRDEQEGALRRRGAPQAMDRKALARFLMHYERLSRVALRELPALADLCLRLDPRRRVVGMKEGPIFDAD